MIGIMVLIGVVTLIILAVLNHLCKHVEEQRQILTEELDQKYNTLYNKIDNIDRDMDRICEQTQDDSLFDSDYALYQIEYNGKKCSMIPKGHFTIDTQYVYKSLFEKRVDPATHMVTDFGMIFARNEVEALQTFIKIKNDYEKKG